MRLLLSSSLLLLVAACASSPSSGTGPDGTVPLADALRAELIQGDAIDLNADLAAGRPIALVFWQAW
jgi:hypothetical protein